MAYGLSVDFVDYGLGRYSLIELGGIPENTSPIVYKTAHKEITDFVGLYIPLGERDLKIKEVRPGVIETDEYIAFIPSSGELPAPLPEESVYYLIRSSSDLEFFDRFCNAPEEIVRWYHHYSPVNNSDPVNGYVRFLGDLRGVTNRIVLYVGSTAPTNVINSPYAINWYNTSTLEVYGYVDGSWVLINITDPTGTNNIDGLFDDWRGFFISPNSQCGSLYFPLLSIVNPVTGNLWLSDVEYSVDGYAYVEYGNSDVLDNSLPVEELCLSLGNAYSLVNGVHGSYVTSNGLPVSLQATLPYFTCGLADNSVIYDTCSVYASIWNQVPGNESYSGLRWNEVSSVALNSSYWLMEFLTAVHVYSSAINAAISAYDFRRGISKALMFSAFNVFVNNLQKFESIPFCPVSIVNVEIAQENEEYDAYYAGLSQEEKDLLALCSGYYDLMVPSRGPAQIWGLGLWGDGVWDDSDPYAYDNFNFHYTALVHRQSYSEQVNMERYGSVILDPLNSLSAMTPATYSLESVNNLYMVLGR
jgi:hypothetical protein